MANFILDSIKQKFGVEEKYQEDGEGFPDMNYVIGNTSGLAVGNIPVPLARRVGDQSQIGGSVMEVQVYNPASYSLEKHELINSINQLGIDITLHSDPNMGYASAYKTQGQQAVGYETVHDYFTQYLQELAKFKREVETRDDVDFDIGRINPHASTSPLPALEERMPLDVGLDPFGYQINEMRKQVHEERSEKGQNIWENEEFLKRLYYTFFLEEVDYEYQYYNLFSQFSTPFKDEWDKARSEAANKFFKEEAKSRENRIREKIGAISTASRQDQGVDIAWQDLQDTEVEGEALIYRFQAETDDEGEFQGLNLVSKDPITELSQVPLLSEVERLVGLSNAYYNFSETGPEIFAQTVEGQPLPMQTLQLLDPESFNEINSNYEKWKQNIDNSFENALDNLWDGNGEENISVDAKVSALASHFDLQQNRIDTRAYTLHDEKLEDEAEQLLMGDEDMFSDDDRDQLQRDPHEELLRRLLQNFEQPMWMESNLFYYIIPCWMSTANEVQTDEHEGWKAPEFIWETLVMDKWTDVDEDEDRKEYDIDLAEPDKEEGYFDALENNREFMLDVAAAVGACYIWGHFTQEKKPRNFETGSEWLDLSDDEEEEIAKEGWTWIDWMNRYGIGVNLEAMHGSPQQLLKLWRPKDIVVAARAINMTARNRLDGDEATLGGKEEMHEQLDGCIAKFTIDMEHVASFGVDPWGEMEELIDQEEALADQDDYKVEAEEDKPLAKMLRQYHLMKPGLEDQQGTRHGPFHRGDKFLYTWLYRLVKAGFARNPGEAAALMYEQGEEKAETTYMARITMNMIELGITPEELDPSRVDPTRDEYEDERTALMARFFGMDKPSYDKEWAKIEEHAFDPLEGLLEAEQFDYTWSGSAAIENDNRPGEWDQEEYR